VVVEQVIQLLELLQMAVVMGELGTIMLLLEQ
jgi:hypothetical protein